MIISKPKKTKTKTHWTKSLSRRLQDNLGAFVEIKTDLCMPLVCCMLDRGRVPQCGESERRD